MVGPAASVDGTVGGAGDLLVQGRLRGRAEVGGSITVAPHAEVEADLVAGGTVRIEAEARFQGDVRAPRVVIVDGASFQGTVDTSGAPPATPDGGAEPAGLDALRRRIPLREP